MAHEHWKARTVLEALLTQPFIIGLCLWLIVRVMVLAEVCVGQGFGRTDPLVAV